MTRRSSPLGGGPGDPWTEALFALTGLAVATGALGLVVWVSGCAVSILTGHGVGPSPLTAGRRFTRTGSLATVWPGIYQPAIVTLAALVIGALLLAAVCAWTRWTAQHPRREGFASTTQFAELLPGRTGSAKTRRLRPTLPTSGRITGSDAGIPLGRLRRTGPLLRGSWEDVVLAICAPRSGKTTCLAVPAVLDAPGPVIATSNKADLWTLTSSPRRRTTDQRIWTFDPQHITPEAQAFTWNPLAGIVTVADARRLAGHFIQEVRRNTDSGDFWDRDAEDLLTSLLLAAALDQAPLTQVGTWLTSVSSVQPRNILTAHGFTQLADTMTGRSQGAHETREGVYATARAATTCLSDPAIMTWVTPNPSLPAFDPASFARSRETLYLLSKDGAGSAAPLIAAFADRIMLDAVRAAETSPAGRLDPPMVAVLDEAANICRITELPRHYSHLGSRGIVPLTILQSRSQGRRVWGDTGMAELFTAATIKLIGAGIDEQAFADELSAMIGDHDVLTSTRTTGRTPSQSRTTRRQRVLPPDQIRALPKFTALMLATGIRPALLHLVPWMNGPHADDIRAAQRELP